MNNIINEDYSLNHREFAILGLISEFPSHAYNLDQRIEERGMRAWTQIGKSSIYNDLGNLEENGLVNSYTEEVDNRTRKIYQITDKGIYNLKNQIYNMLNEYDGRNDPDFYMAFSMLPYLSKQEQVEVFSNSLKLMKKHKMDLEHMLENNIKQPLNVRGLFIHPIKILQTDIEFLEAVLEEIRRGAGQVDPKDYSK
jgi:DNA-binding PadR family transcriptional regulator